MFIIVLDDDTNIRRVCARLLLKEYPDAELLLTADPNFAIAATGLAKGFRKTTPLLITDGDLGDHLYDGVDVIERVRDRILDDASPQTVCILMSGEGTYKERAIQKGAVAFIAKPFGVNFIETVKEVLRSATYVR